MIILFILFKIGLFFSNTHPVGIRGFQPDYYSIIYVLYVFGLFSLFIIDKEKDMNKILKNAREEKNKVKKYLTIVPLNLILLFSGIVYIYILPHIINLLGVYLILYGNIFWSLTLIISVKKNDYNLMRNILPKYCISHLTSIVMTIVFAIYMIAVFLALGLI